MSERGSEIDSWRRGYKTLLARDCAAPPFGTDGWSPTRAASIVEAGVFIATRRGKYCGKGLA